LLSVLRDSENFLPYFLERLVRSGFPGLTSFFLCRHDRPPSPALSLMLRAEEADPSPILHLVCERHPFFSSFIIGIRPSELPSFMSPPLFRSVLPRYRAYSPSSPYSILSERYPPTLASIYFIAGTFSCLFPSPPPPLFFSFPL